MKDEIKEILGRLEIVARKHTIEVCDDGSKIETMPASLVDELRLNNYSSKLLLDYITNLQEENKKLKEKNKHIFANVNDDQLLRSNAMNYAELQDYKTRNEKVISYIDSLFNTIDYDDEEFITFDTLESIQNLAKYGQLQGKSDE